MTIDELSLLETAKASARAAGMHARNNRHRCQDADKIESHDIKLVLDRECQEVAEQTILEKFPSHGILGEENSIASDSEYEWIIDPIDGTINFFHSLSHWCSSIAVRKEGEMIAGAVFLPDFDEMYAASANGPALCNDIPIKPTDTRSIDQSMLLYGLGKSPDSNASPYDCIRILYHKFHITRVLGAAAVDLCFVACGKADAYIDNHIHIWDVAAGGLIAQRAGANLAILEQEEKRIQVICSSPGISDELLSETSDLL